MTYIYVCVRVCMYVCVYVCLCVCVCARARALVCVCVFTWRPRGPPGALPSPPCLLQVVHCWDKTGLLGAWLSSNQILAVTRAEELFHNLAPARRGLDDAPPPDPEPETDVGAPLDCPGDVPVLLPSGTVHRPGAAEDELLMAASWVDWDLLAMSS